MKSCEVCQKPFTAKRPRQCCSRSCSGILANQTKGRAWHQEETWLLEKFAASLPLPEIVKRVKRLEKRLGLPVRTDVAIRLKVKRLGLSQKCELDNFTRWQLARHLGIGYDRVEAWSQKYGLPCRKVARNQSAIAIKDLTEFAMTKPHQLGGIERDRIAWLLGDDIAAVCATYLEPMIGKSMPVKRLDTGEVFPSIKAAARASFVNHTCISEAIKRGGKSAGTHWELVS